ncbi:MAG: histidine kinase [Bacteroidota bacterium]
MNKRNIYKEILFQIIFHLVVFVFYSFDRNQPSVEAYKYVYFLNYATAAAIINYICLPIFYKRKNILIFVGMVIACILASALLEEFVLERVFFSGRRAKSIKMLWAFVDIIPIVAILSGVKFGWDALMKQKEVDKLEEVIKESELQFLKSQINPHFLFNNLNNLYSYALEGSKKTPEIILQLSGLLRYMLYECKEKYVPLSKELKQLENFINLNRLQIEDRGKINFTSDIYDHNEKIAPLIMLVFVENAFKHSQSSQSDQIKIDIGVRLDKDRKLTFTCNNSYREIANSPIHAKGIGLENVKKRLDLIYPDAHELTISDNNQFYKVKLTIHLQKDQSS